jgi:hypothetical protein
VKKKIAVFCRISSSLFLFGDGNDVLSKLGSYAVLSSNSKCSFVPLKEGE